MLAPRLCLLALLGCGSSDVRIADATSNDATSNDATSNDATSNDATSNDATSNDATSNDAASNDATSNDAASNDDASPAGCRADTTSCPRGQYCHVENCGLTGVCVEQPSAASCDFSYSPVCSCAGPTFDNACLAAAAGRSLRPAGQCDIPLRRCGGVIGAACVASDYCFVDTADQCGTQGVCRARPTSCAPATGTDYCSCGREQYASPCVAAMAGVSVTLCSNLPSE